jgi:hypothetical protein
LLEEDYIEEQVQDNFNRIKREFCTVIVFATLALRENVIIWRFKFSNEGVAYGRLEKLLEVTFTHDTQV